MYEDCYVCVCVQVDGKMKGVVEVPVAVTHPDQQEVLKTTILNYALQQKLLQSHDQSCDLRDRMIVASHGRLVNIVNKK